MVISDVHLMHPDLLKNDGEAFREYVSYDRKMLKESPELMEEATEAVLREHPQYLLVAGDLTKDGETISHKLLCERYLSRIRRAGIQVFVVPGNHDVDNPHAVEFDGSITKRVDTPRAEEFAEIYKDYGYGQAIARDTASLSYVVELGEGLRLLCLDACEYEENSYDENTCVTAGRLKPATLEFIKTQAEAAAKEGSRMLAMMHHGIVEHWKWQERAMGDYLVAKWKRRAAFMKKLGVEVVFTGHFHANDIASHAGLYDIETGSLVSYPSPYRFVRFSGNLLTVSTRYLEGSYLRLPEGVSLKDYSKEYAIQGVSSIAGGMLPEDCPDTLREHACRVLGEAYVAHLGGDEQFTEVQKAEIKAIARKLKKYSWKMAYIFSHLARYFSTDLEPCDNEITITLQ